MISEKVTTRFNYMEVTVDLNNSSFNGGAGTETRMELPKVEM